MRKRDRVVSKLKPKALEANFVGYTERDNGYLVYAHNTRKVVAVRDLIIKDSEVSLIADNTETPKWSQPLGIWHPDDGHKDNGNKGKRSHLAQ